MPIDTHPRHKRAPEEITAQQKEQAAKDKARAKAREATGNNLPVEKRTAGNGGAAVPATVAANTAVAVPDNRTPVQQYLDQVAPASIVGRMNKFDGKGGGFVTNDDDATVGNNIDFVALCDQTLIGWIKFRGEGEPPDRQMGLLYDGFTMPPRGRLGDDDQTKWEIGLDGKPADPWQHFMYLVLQNGSTGELFTYTTSSVTGRRAVGNLLRHYDRLQKANPDQYPVVRLKVGGFQHRDERVGWVPVPLLAVVGRAAKDSAAKPDTSAAGDMNDQIPF